MSFLIPFGKRNWIELRDWEVLLLKELLTQRIMKSSDVHAFYHAMAEPPVHSKSISRRLSRLVEAGVLLRIEKNIRGYYRRIYYKLAKKGLTALVNEGIIQQSEMSKIYQWILQAQIPKPHNLALSTLVNKIRIETYNQGIDLLAHKRGGEWIEDERLQIQKVPDWVFESKEAIVLLELDTGSERLKEITDKVRGYIDYCSTTDKNVFVVFSYWDSSVDADKSSQKTGRVASLKSAIPPIYDLPSNLKVYTLGLDRTVYPVIRILKGNEPIPKTLRKAFLNEWVFNWEVAMGDNVRIEEISIDDMYNGQRIKPLEADMVVRLIEGKRNRYIGLLYGEEGSLLTYQQIRFNSRRTTDLINSEHKFDCFLVIYPDHESVEFDVCGDIIGNEVWYSSPDTWNYSVKSKRYPRMLKQLSKYKRKWVRFE